VLPKRVIENYLNAPRDDLRWLKKLSHREIDRLLSELRPRPHYNPKLGLHQKVGLYAGIKYGSFAFWYDMGCVDGDTEYLSPTGWVKIKDYTNGLVAQYEPETRRARFVQPTAYIDRHCSEMYHFKSARGCDQMVSPEHNMLVVAGEVDRHSAKSHPSPWKHTPVSAIPEYASEGFPTRPCFYKVRPSEILGKTVRVETTFLMDRSGLSLTDAQLRLQIAVHADGHLPNKSTCIVSIKKARKKARLRKLLREANVSFTESDSRHPTKLGYTFFRFRPPLHTKKYGPEWWKASLEQRRVICDEVVYWDGSPGKSGGSNFFSRSKLCADFIQFCFASTRRRAFLGVSGVDYTVHAIGDGRTTNLASLRGGAVVPAPGGRKYCFEVPSHYLVLRRNGNIFVTGNTGKTFMSLELLQYWWDIGAMRRAIVFVISDKAYPTWERQIRQYKINIPYCMLDSGSSEGKWRILEHFDEGIAFVHYPGAVAMVNGRGKTTTMLDQKKVNRLLRNVDVAVFDESTKAGNIQSLTYKLCKKATQAAEHRYTLAGMPFGRDPTPLWSQMYLTDQGETLGETLGLFREAFFTEKDNYWGGPYSKKYKFKKPLERKLSRIIQHSSLTYTVDECIDLPPVRRIVEMVRLSATTKAYYQEVVAEIISSKGNMKAMKNAFLRMRQLSSGFLGLRDDETGERAEVEFDDNPKLELLLNFLDTLNENRKALIYYQYTVSGRRISKAIKEELDIPHIWLWSGTKSPAKDMQRFMDDPATRYAVIQNDLGAFSLDGLQVANYEFFFESPVSTITRSQAERRIWRQGQRHKSFLYDLVVQGTVDEKILDFHQEGKDLFKALLANPAKMLGRL
jgi:hypothetical protein